MAGLIGGTHGLMLFAWVSEIRDGDDEQYDWYQCAARTLSESQ
jgi:hypothetical protein